MNWRTRFEVLVIVGFVIWAVVGILVGFWVEAVR